MKILLIVFFALISFNYLNAKDSEFKNPPYFIYFDRIFTPDGMMLRYILTTKEIEYSQKRGHKIPGPLGPQIIVDSNCLFSIKTFITKFQNKQNILNKLNNSNRFKKYCEFRFYEVYKYENKNDFFEISNANIAIDFFEKMLIYIKDNKFHYPNLNKEIKSIIKSLK
jgi:hypothetical protein